MRDGVLGARISIAAPDAADFGTFDLATRAAFALLHRIDDVFCAPRPGGSARRTFEGLLGAADPGGRRGARESREARELCETLRAVGEEVFDALDGGGAWDGSGYVGRPAAGRDGGARLDPRKAVKCWAVERASDLLEERGLTRHLVNAGGDLKLRSDAGSGPAWRVRLADPRLAGGLLATLEIREGAVATRAAGGPGLPADASGAALAAGPARGALAQVAVVGADLARADLYATAAMAQPTADRARAWLDGLAASTAYQALSVDTGGRIHTTAGLAGRLHLEPEPGGSARWPAGPWPGPGTTPTSRTDDPSPAPSGTGLEPASEPAPDGAPGPPARQPPEPPSEFGGSGQGTG
ncbi:hypothetical protein RVR_617 [Actinacidiphila reveromycinica]|uniref:FAD:protein FMN transferase n=1 Tax=Actinacidiphila reveromycinica TaxID=659352 RepID=A0A7U3VLL7_9ACTN|nr:hypothetical protein RVR_617 [Streptomyces sp. SN-593]